jgi:hypothetical protein
MTAKHPRDPDAELTSLILFFRKTTLKCQKKNKKLDKKIYLNVNI